MKNITLAFKFYFYIWVLTFILAGYHLLWVPSIQERFLSVSGIEIDFVRNPKLTIGGLYKQITGNDKAASIQLPTNRIPTQIGTLEFINGEVQLELNNKISDSKDEVVLEKCFPRILSLGNNQKVFTKNEVIPSKVLFGKGIIIDYAVQGYITVRLRKLEKDKHYRLEFSPDYSKLRFPLRNYYQEGGQEIELRVNGKDPLNTPNFDIPLIDVYVPSSPAKNKILRITQNQVSLQNGEILGDAGTFIKVPDTKVFVKLEEPQKPLYGSYIMILLYGLVGVLLYLLNRTNAPPTPWQKITMHFDSLFYLLGILFHFSIPLCLHYSYFFPYKVERLEFIWSGALALTLYTTINIIKAPVSEFIKRNEGVKFWRLLDWVFLMLWFFLFAIAVFFSSGERIFGFPSHVIARALYLTSLYLAVRIQTHFAVVFKNTLLRPIFIILLVGLVYAALVSDWGFFILTLFFVFLYELLKANNNSNLFYYRLILIFSLILSCSFIFPQVFSSNVSFFDQPILDRFHLVYNNQLFGISDTQNSHSIKLDDKMTSGHHRFLLMYALEDFGFRLSAHNLQIPKGFRSVIHTDYVLLYGALYYGGFFWIVAGLILFLICYTLASWSLYFRHQKVILVGIFFILLGYVAHILYMYGAILRVFPLTGQSIPFLALSKVEPFALIFFLTVAKLVIHREKDKKNAINSVEIVKDISRKSPLIFYLVLFLFLIVSVIGYLKVKSDYRYLAESPIKIGGYSTKQNYLYNKKFLPNFSNKIATPSFHAILQNTELKTLKDNIRGFSRDNREVKRFFRLIATHYWGQERKFFFSNASSQEDKHHLFFNPREARFLKYESYKERLFTLPFQSEPLAKFSNESLLLKELNGKLYTNLSMVTKESSGGYFQILSELTNSDTSAQIKTLLGPNPKIQTRLINGQREVQIYNAGLLGQLPDLNEIANNDKPSLPELSIDPKLQIILHGLIQNYPLNKGQKYQPDVKAGVVIDNETGEVKAMVGAPFITANENPMIKVRTIKALNNLGWGISESYPNVPLTGYNIASTMKVFLAATALLIDSNLVNQTFPCSGQDTTVCHIACHSGEGHGPKVTMQEFITKSCNHYSVQLFRLLRERYSSEFKNILKHEMNINASFNERLSMPPSGVMNGFEEPNIGQLNDLSNSKLAQISIGGYNVKVPLLSATTSFGRVVSGKRLYPVLFKNKNIEFENIENHSNLYPLMQYLKENTSHGTAMETLGTFECSNKPGKSMVIFSKTGTGRGKSSFLIFGTEKYSIGIMLLKNGGFDQSDFQAKNFAADLFLEYCCELGII